MLPQRRSPRLQGYDYSESGAYFVTICCHQREHLFGHITDGTMHLSPAGQIALERWFAIPEHHAYVDLDAFVVMPNHVHGIVILTGIMPTLSGTKESGATDTEADRAGPVPRLSTVVGAYKSGVTRRIREALSDPELSVWQGRYHDHIIRNEADLARIREYVMYNPARWHSDTFYDAPIL